MCYKSVREYMVKQSFEIAKLITLFAFGIITDYWKTEKFTWGDLENRESTDCTKSIQIRYITKKSSAA